MKLRRLVLAVAMAALAGLAGCRRDDGGALTVVIALPDHSIPNAAKGTLTVDYSGSGASILANEGVADCAFILPGVDGDFSDDHKGTLTIHTAGPRALRGPADIAACRMRGGAGATATELQEKLSVRIAAAEDAAGKTIDVASGATRPRAAARSEEAVAQAQAEAVKAASAVSASAPPPAPAAGAATSALPGAATAPGASHSGAPSPGGAAGAVASGNLFGAAGAAGGIGATKAPTGPKLPAPIATPGALARGGAAGAANVGSGANPQDNSAVDPHPDSDPSYDDSPSDNESVPAYNLTFAASGPAGMMFGALQFTVTHLGNSGGFIGRGASIDCQSQVDAIVAANYVGERVANFGLISLQGVRLNVPIIVCGFRTREALSPNSFQIDVTDTSDTAQDSKPLDPEPTVSILSIVRR